MYEAGRKSFQGPVIVCLNHAFIELRQMHPTVDFEWSQAVSV